MDDLDVPLAALILIGRIGVDAIWRLFTALSIKDTEKPVLTAESAEPLA